MARKCINSSCPKHIYSFMSKMLVFIENCRFLKRNAKIGHSWNPFFFLSVLRLYGTKMVQFLGFGNYPLKANEALYTVVHRYLVLTIDSSLPCPIVLFSGFYVGFSTLFVPYSKSNQRNPIAIRLSVCQRVSHDQ